MRNQAEGKMTRLKEFLNYIRSVLLFRIRYPWIEFGRNVHVQWSVSFWAPTRKIRMGNNVGIGYRCVIMSDVVIGNDVAIAPHVAFLSRSTHRFDVVGTSIFQSPRGDKGEIVIEDDVWIGFGAIILSGVRIGRGSVIAAGAVVVKDVPPYSIVIPRQNHVIRQRFSPEEIEAHEAGLRHAGVMTGEPSQS